MSDPFDINPELMELETDYEFYERLVDDSRVTGDPPVGSDTIFDDQFERRARELNRTPFKGTQKVSPIHLRSGPWSANNQVGIEQQFDPDTNNRQTILKLSEWGMPSVWSVNLGLDFAPINPDTYGFSVVALVTAGSGGATQEFEVDWLSGASFSVCMNAINVVAAYDVIGAAGTIPPDLKLRVTIARGGGRTTCFPPQRTLREPTALLASGSSDIQQIPPFAKRLHITASSTPAAAASSAIVYNAANRLRFLPSETSLLPSSVYNGDILTSFPDGVPIPLGARYVEFENNSGTTIEFLSYIFSLSL